MKKILLTSIFAISLSIIGYSQCSDPYAGQDTAFCGLTAELTVENTTTGYWTAYFNEVELSPTPTYSPSNTSTSIEVTISEIDGFSQIIEFVWTDDSGPCNDTVLVDFIEEPNSYAGQDFDVCGTCADLNATGDAMWTSWLPTPGSIFTDYESPESEICVSSYGYLTYTWLISNSSSIASTSCSDMNEVIVTFWREPTATILTDPADSTACGLTYDHLYAENPGTGIWGYWLTSSPTTHNPVDGNSVTVSAYGYHDFYWIEENGPPLQSGLCRDTAGPLTIHFLEPYIALAGSDNYTYGIDYTLLGFSPHDENPYTDYVSTWEHEYAIFDDINDLQTNVTVPSFGEYEFIVNGYLLNMPTCISSDTVLINFRDPIYSDVDNQVVTNKLNIYPNPNNGIFTLDIGFVPEKSTNISIFDALGREVKQIDINQFNGTSLQLDLSSLTKGIYLINIKSERGKQTKKLVIQ